MHLSALLPTFTTFYLTNSSEPPPTSPDDPDMQVSLSQLGCPLLNFISQVIRVRKAKELLEQPGALEQLLRVVLAWVEMTEEDEENWTSNINLFLADEDDNTDTYTLRVAGLDLISVCKHALWTSIISLLDQRCCLIYYQSRPQSPSKQSSPPSRGILSKPSKTAFLHGGVRWRLLWPA